jgi:hypothetical protein
MLGRLGFKSCLVQMTGCCSRTIFLLEVHIPFDWRKNAKRRSTTDVVSIVPRCHTWFARRWRNVIPVLDLQAHEHTPAIHDSRNLGKIVEHTHNPLDYVCAHYDNNTPTQLHNKKKNIQWHLLPVKLLLPKGPLRLTRTPRLNVITSAARARTMTTAMMPMPTTIMEISDSEAMAVVAALAAADSKKLPSGKHNEEVEVVAPFTLQNTSAPRKQGVNRNQNKRW